ncbi:Ger(x)C family spore germination protein [Clostridium senegalense]|uniref:Ger(x)C family spore germination protein n=1 Tax=Clostridium senegalense TaxID=1465809 RepID=UPI0002883AC2|nr:Ger(x)C family spore germination protein [Clostridium senegalense]
MKMKKIILIMIMSLMLVGCSDSVEIDNKAFVSTIAIDVGQDIENRNNIKEIKTKDPFTEEGLALIEVTYGMPDIRNMEPEKGSAEEISITSTGYSMTDAYFNALSKTSRELHFGHSKLLLLSERIFDYPDVLSGVLDYISRDSILNRSMLMVITKGDAKDYVGYKPVTEDNIENYISGLMLNSSKKSIIVPVTLHNYFSTIGRDEVLIPYIGIEGEDLKIYGMKVIEKLTPKGLLNNSQVSNIQLIKGDIGATEKIAFIEDKIVDYQIDDTDSKLRVSYDKEKNKLHLNYHVITEGEITGAYMGARMLDSDKINNIQNQLSDSMEREFLETFKVLQKDYNIDPLEIRDHIIKFKPTLWREIKDNWIQLYKDADITFDVESKIRNVGVSN